MNTNVIATGEANRTPSRLYSLSNKVLDSEHFKNDSFIVRTIVPLRLRKMRTPLRGVIVVASVVVSTVLFGTRVIVSFPKFAIGDIVGVPWVLVVVVRLGSEE